MYLLSLHKEYIFKDLGIFELFKFQFIPFDLNESFNSIFPKIKQLNFFTYSKAYLTLKRPHGNIEQFANFDLGKISNEDYILLSFEEFILKLAFERNNNIDKKYAILHSDDLEGEVTIRGANKKITEYVTKNINRSALVYELNISRIIEEKLGESLVWDYFRSFIGIDKEKNSLYLITIGSD